MLHELAGVVWLQEARRELVMAFAPQSLASAHSGEAAAAFRRRTGRNQQNIRGAKRI